MAMSGRKSRHFSFLIIMFLCFHVHTKAQEHPGYKEIPVGVILDMGSPVGKIVRSWINMAVSDCYTTNSHYKTRIVVHNRDTRGEPLHALSAALDLLEKPKVQAIIGSESTAEAKFLAVLGDEARVPILSLSPTPSSNKHPYLLQITQDETTQVKAIAEMVELFGWKNVILICEDTDSGREMATFMTESLQEKNIFITYSSLISVSASSELVHLELHKLSRLQTKIYIMHVTSSLASHLFLNAKHLGMMDAGYKWIITDKTMNFFNFMDDEVIELMHGVVGFKSYIPQSSYLHKFTLKWRKEYDAKDINAYAIWAYDAVSALAMAVERTQFVLELNTNDMETSGSAQWGIALLNQMVRISFDGLSGTFQFMNGKITAQVLEVVNVLDKREHRVGFWKTDTAFTKKIGKPNSFSDDGLEAIVWTGGNPTKMTHRMLQMSSKVLRIGIPVQYRSGGFFRVEYDTQNNKLNVSGFCVDVFQASISLPFEFIPFIKEAKVGTVNYNDLIEKVHAGEFDAAIGDISITANRSLYVDFTLPYTDLGLATLYRNTDASMWIFMEPLSSDLWVVSVFFIILVGFIIWILEHRTNEEFQGSLVQQIGTTFWFAFSTIFYAHSQNLQSNLSRFVVTVWLFVVFVLVSSYTATLSSLLTVEQIQLESKRGSIGYPAGTLVQGFIVRNLNFEDTRLKPYSKLEEYAEALLRGSKKGGVDAIVDEIPYIKEFLAKYPSGYSMVVSEDITNGFGFAFPLGSPLVPAISRQIAKLREDGTLKELENKWLSPQSKDSAPEQKVLNFKGLRGLFLISGVSMAAALFLFMIQFIQEKLQFTYATLTGGKLAFIMNLLIAKSANAIGRR